MYYLLNYKAYKRILLMWEKMMYEYNKHGAVVGGDLLAFFDQKKLHHSDNIRFNCN